jgi:lactate permease
MTSNVPTDLLHWLIAFLPIALLLVLLVLARWKAAEAAPVGMFLAAGIAILAFRTSAETVAVASGKGIWDALFILYVIWPALLLYRVVDRAGAFEGLRRGVASFSRSELFLVLAFGWGFASFLQGITGFGTPIAVVAPLLVAIGVQPLYAVIIPLIGHAWANLFGTLGVAWLATTTVIDLENVTRTAWISALMLWIPNLLAGVSIAWLFGRRAAVARALPLILIVSGLHGGIQLGLVFWNPVLANFIAATVGLIAFYPLSHWQRYSEPMDDAVERRVLDEEGDLAPEDDDEPIMGLPMALVPYIVLTFAAVAVLVIGPVEDALARLEVGISLPGTSTGYGVATDAADSYSPFAPLTHPGAFLLIAAAVSWVVYRSRGYYEKWNDPDATDSIGRAMAKDALPASVAITGFLVMSQVMGHSGQTDTLALGVASVAPALAFAFFANWIGMLGSFMTSSNTTSNVLFAPLQQSVASLEGLSEPAVIAAQNTGGAVGNAASPANIVLGTGPAGISGQEGQVLRRTLIWAAAVAVVTGGLTMWFA